MVAAGLLIISLLVSGVMIFCVCKHAILPSLRSIQRREILSKKKYKKVKYLHPCNTSSHTRLTKKYVQLTAETGMSSVHTYDDDDDDDEDVTIDAANQMMLKVKSTTTNDIVCILVHTQKHIQRVEYSSRELEQLKLLDAAIDDEDILDSDSLHFPENDNMDLTDNDEFESLEEATSIILKDNPYKTERTDQPSKSIFENDTEDETNLQLVSTNLNPTNNTSASNANNKGENNENEEKIESELINKKD